MTLIPTLRVANMRRSVEFYTQVLDFRCLDDDFGDPAHCVLKRKGRELHLSSHAGDGAFGQAVVVLERNVDRLFKSFVERGLRPPTGGVSPVEEGPVDQSWGTREFYVRDPDGHCLRFTRR